MCDLMSICDPWTIGTGVNNISLLQHICDPCIFQEKMRHLMNGKAPGPDGIPNEVLKHQAIDKLWMTGITPNAWKESRAILLHEKSSEHDLGRRPLCTYYGYYGQVWLQNACIDMLLSRANKCLVPNPHDGPQLLCCSFLVHISCSVWYLFCQVL